MFIRTQHGVLLNVDCISNLRLMPESGREKKSARIVAKMADGEEFIVFESQHDEQVQEKFEDLVGLVCEDRRQLF